MALPKLRPLDTFAVQEGERTYLALRDTEGYSDNLVLLSPIDALIALRLDGKTTAAKVAEDIGTQAGIDEFPVKRVWDLVLTLDKNLMLESEHFLEHKKSVTEAFLKSGERPAFMAERGYPGEAEALSKTLDEYLSLPELGSPPKKNRSLTALVAPHIDYDRGKAGYGWAYREIMRSGLADLYVVLGVAHSTPPTPLVLSNKDYGTPFGPAETDRDLAAALAKDAPYNILADEVAHRTEHSIEFQAVFLKHAQRRLGGDFKILPVLCSSCDLSSAGPGERTLKTLELLEKKLKDYPGKVCLLAGVDLAHVGPRFGDKEAVSEELLARVEEQDRDSLALVLAKEPDAFLDSVMSDGNRRNVCGVVALYVFSWLQKRLHPNSKGRLLHYAHSPDPSGGEVTFASLAFR